MAYCGLLDDIRPDPVLIFDQGVGWTAPNGLKL
jgi:hypothetical protein